MDEDFARLPRALGFLRWPRAHVALALLAALLASPALGVGLLLDDQVFALMRTAPGVLPVFSSDPFFLFTFTSGRPEDNRALMDIAALLPWWSDPFHLNAFFRPLSSLSHALDFALWPGRPWLMHLHSLLWFVALLLVVAHVYRRLAAPGGSLAIALLSFALFALDDAHGMTVAWVANRNALIAATLALPALGAHHRWLATGWRAGAIGGPACFALGLCAGETAVSVFGYLLAYALVLDRGALWRRLVRLWPYVAVLATWALIFSALGLGSRGSGAYHNPLQEPLAFAFALADHLPLLLSAQLALPLADVVFWGAPEAHLALWLLSVVTLLALGYLAVHFLRHDERAHFWALGMLLSACVVAASVPGERLLLVPGVGGSVLIARLLWALWTAPGPTFATRAIAAGLVVLHLVVAPVALPLRAQGVGVLRATIERADRSLPATTAHEDEVWVVYNAPFDVMLSYTQITRAAEGRERPAHLYWLATASSPLQVMRLDAHTLRVTPAGGFVRSSPERHYRGEPAALSPGTRVELSEMTVEVQRALPDGRPAAADFRFHEPLEAPRYRFFAYEAGRFRPHPPPPPGGELHFPREDFFRTLLREAL